MALAAESQFHGVHFVLFPLMAPGHMIPMIDIAKLLAARPNVVVSFVSTAQNISRFDSTISRAAESGRKIRVVEIRFPSAEAGLPEGCENLDSLPSLEMATNFFAAVNLLQKEVGQVLDEMRPPPSCIISDMGLPWTTQISDRLHIPRIVFHGTCCFSLLCSHNIRASGILDTLESDSDPFEVPNLPHRIVMRKSQVSYSTVRKSTVLMKEARDQIIAAEKTSYGVLVNSFEELEKEYVKAYSKAKGEKVWCIGPVSLCNKETLDLSERGNQAGVDGPDCLKWLDSKKPGSVIYASLGTLARLAAPQMAELALGLEASNRPFIWALGGIKSEGFEEWVSDNGFEGRIKGQGLIARDWAPQVMILSHPAIGAFLTHCGWNSTLEGITAGVPMVTWPRFADQFCNERLVVQVLGIGVEIGVEEPVKWGEEEKVPVMVTAGDVATAVETVMDGGAEGEKRRRMAQELGDMAKKATEEGGSSCRNIDLLVEDIARKSMREV